MNAVRYLARSRSCCPPELPQHQQCDKPWFCMVPLRVTAAVFGQGPPDRRKRLPATLAADFDILRIHRLPSTPKNVSQTTRDGSDANEQKGVSCQVPSPAPFPVRRGSCLPPPLGEGAEPNDQLCSAWDTAWAGCRTSMRPTWKRAARPRPKTTAKPISIATMAA